MTYCYYCGSKLSVESKYCGKCGKCVVADSDGTNHAEDQAAKAKPDAKAKQDAKTRDEGSTKKSSSHARKIKVSGNTKRDIFVNSRKLSFTGGKGKLLFTAEGHGDSGGNDLFSSGTDVRGEYQIYDASGRNVGAVLTRDAWGGDSDSLDVHEIIFQRHMPAQQEKKPAKGLLNKIGRALVASEEKRANRVRFEPEQSGLFGTLGNALANKTVRVAGDYRAVSEGKPLSLVPTRTEVFYQDDLVATMRCKDKNYVITCNNPKHDLTVVMIFLGLYFHF